MLPIPPELLRESGLASGQSVRLRSRPGHIEIEPAETPGTEVVAFAQRFARRYRRALAQLADR